MTSDRKADYRKNLADVRREKKQLQPYVDSYKQLEREEIVLESLIGNESENDQVDLVIEERPAVANASRALSSALQEVRQRRRPSPKNAFLRALKESAPRALSDEELAMAAVRAGFEKPSASAVYYALYNARRNDEPIERLENGSWRWTA
jgi:hypothetical protein